MRASRLLSTLVILAASAALAAASAASDDLDRAAGTNCEDRSSTRLTPAGFGLLGYDRDGRATVISGSADGRSWDRLEPSTPGWPVQALGAGPLGWIAATKDTSRSSTRLKLWFSDNGRIWELLADQAGIGESSVSGLGSDTPITAGGAGFAITASVGGGSVPAVWTSSDGRRWHEAQALHGMGIDRVIVVPDGYLAFAPGLTTAMFSTDGTTWRDIGSDPGSPFGAYAGGLIVGPLDATITVLRVDEVGVPDLFTGDVTTAATGGAIAWRHRTAVDAGFAGAGLSTAASSGGSAVILGYDLDSLAPIAWTSTDGIDWHREAIGPSAFGGGVPALSAVGSFGKTRSFVALGARANAAGDVRPVGLAVGRRSGMVGGRR